MVKFGCSETKMRTEDVQHALLLAITQSTVDCMMWRRDHAKLAGLADKVGQ